MTSFLLWPGPSVLEDRVDLNEMKSHFIDSLTHEVGHHGHGLAPEDLSKGAIVEMDGEMFDTTTATWSSPPSPRAPTLPTRVS